MKDSNINLPKARVYRKENQCDGKWRYKFKRRALKDAHELSRLNPDFIFSVYECPHCGFYHVGKVRK